MRRLLVDAGQLSPRDVALSGVRHILTNALGGSTKEVHVDVDLLRLENGDRLLLCSDGLTDGVDDETIAATLGAALPSSEVCAETPAARARSRRARQHHGDCRHVRNHRTGLQLPRNHGRLLKPIPIHAFNPGPYTGDGNWTWLIPGRVPTLIDAGTGEPRHLEALERGARWRGAVAGHRDARATPTMRRACRRSRARCPASAS